MQSFWSIFRDSRWPAAQLTQPRSEEACAADEETSESTVKEAEFRSLFQTTLLEMKQPQAGDEGSDTWRM